MSKVYVKFPKTGLGNLMLVWARACVFAHLNDLPLVMAPWWAVRLGAWKRNENKKRMYWGYFKESSFLSRLIIFWNRFFYQLIKEPPIEKLKYAETAGKKIFVFDQAFVGNDLFGPIRNYRVFLKSKIIEMLRPALQQQLNNYELPVISVHIRRGDFKLGNPVTPQSFFIDCIHQIRLAGSNNWEVTVFTDADADEINEVLALDNIKLADSKPDILDILLMSKSKVIVLSQSSTFSYWGAFLSDAIILKPCDDWQGELRSNDINKISPEISWREADLNCIKLLKESIEKDRQTLI